MGQMEYLPVDPNAAEYEVEPTSPAHAELREALRPFGGKISLYYHTSSQHCGGLVFRSEEERLEACSKGEQEILETVEKMDLERLKNAIDAYHEHVQEIMKEHPRLAGQY